MRVLLLSPTPTLRGPLPKHTPVLVSALRKVGCEVVQEPWGRHADEESLWAKPRRLVRDIRRIRRALLRCPVDVMVVKTSHEWMSLLRDIPLLLVARSLVPSIALQFHGGRSDVLVGPGNGAFKGASRLLLSRSDGLLLLSSEEARETQSFYQGCVIRTVSNPFLPTDEPLVRRNGRTEPTLLFASRLVPEKGILDTLEAVALLRRHRRVRLLIAGGGPAQADVEARIQTLGLAANVELLGHLDAAAMKAMYRDADVFVLPTYWIEGFPTAISEAMNAGLPVVTTKTRGMADHLEEGKNAVFVPQRDPTALAEALERLLGDQTLRDQMSEANQAKVADFAPDRVAREYLNALEDIVASTGKGRE
jgi:glycosyltransferase involved in cell wall biosynthesis